MKPRFYLLILIILVPLHASLFGPLATAGIKPDIPLAVVYIIGLLTGPVEGAIAGMAIGLLQDTASAGLIGIAGFTRGAMGLLSGLLGRKVLDIASPSNIIFLSVFSLAEGFLISLFIQSYYGSMPFFRIFFTTMMPQAFYTAVLGTLMLRLINKKGVINILTRRQFHKE